ncbi:MAG: hypothetical protein V4436_01165 [Patescibacteria group bacterium]
MRIKNFSWASFFIGGGVGLVLGALVLGVFVNYLISHAISNESTDKAFLGGAIDQVREGIAIVNAENKATSAFGHVVSISGGVLVLNVTNSQGSKEHTFTYDDNTKFITFANDAASTEIPFSADTIQIGDGLTVHMNEIVGSVVNQYVVKVYKI